MEAGSTRSSIALLVACIGTLVADIIPSDLLKVSAPGNAFAPAEARLRMVGHATNVSIDLLRLGLQRGEVSCTGTTGEDSLDGLIAKELERSGVVTHLERVRTISMSLNRGLVAQGESQGTQVEFDSNQYLDPHKVKDLLRKERPCILYIGGAGRLGEFDEQLPKVLREAKEELNCVTFVAPVNPRGDGLERVLRSLQWVDILHCAREDAANMTGKIKPTESLDNLANRGAKLVVITLGEQGLVAKQAYDRIIMPAFKVPTIDATGAGDAFSAGAIYCLIRFADGVKKLDIAALTRRQFLDLLLESEAAAAASMTGESPTEAVTRENVDRILNEQKSTIMDQMRIGFKPF